MLSIWTKQCIPSLRGSHVSWGHSTYLVLLPWPGHSWQRVSHQILPFLVILVHHTILLQHKWYHAKMCCDIKSDSFRTIWLDGGLHVNQSSHNCNAFLALLWHRGKETTVVSFHCTVFRVLILVCTPTYKRFVANNTLFTFVPTAAQNTYCTYYFSWLHYFSYVG